MRRFLFSLAAFTFGYAPTSSAAPWELTLQDRLWFPSLFWEGDTLGGSDCWGWVSPDSTNYAFMGIVDGTAVCRVVEEGPQASLELIQVVPGPKREDFFFHRDYKTLGNYLYHVAEMTGQGEGVQIMDLSTLPDSVRVVDNYVYRNQVTSHNLSIDVKTGFAYVLRSDAEGLRILDLNDPEDPQELPWHFIGDLHDVYADNDTVWVAEGWTGNWSVWDFTDKEDPSLLARVVPPDLGYLHNIWPTEDRSHVVTTQETDYRTVKIWDVRDLSDIQLVSEYLAPSKLAHNAHVEGDFAFISHYQSGVRMVDIRQPSNPVEVAFFDTYPAGEHPRFNGCWGVFPHTARGYVYASDIEGYLTLLKATEEQPCPGLRIANLDTPDPVFVGDTGSGAVVLENCSEASYNVVAKCDCEWLRVVPGQAPLDPGEVRSLELSVDARDLVPGDYACPVTLTYRDTSALEFSVPVTIRSPLQLSIRSAPDFGRRGEILQWEFDVINVTDKLRSTDGWFEAYLPGGEPYAENPFSGPFPGSLSAHSTATFTKAVTIPRNTPLGGPYEIVTVVGDYPSSSTSEVGAPPDVWATASFSFTVRR